MPSAARPPLRHAIHITAEQHQLLVAAIPDFRESSFAMFTVTGILCRLAAACLN